MGARLESLKSIWMSYGPLFGLIGFPVCMTVHWLIISPCYRKNTPICQKVSWWVDVYNLELYGWFSAFFPAFSRLDTYTSTVITERYLFITYNYLSYYSFYFILFCITMVFTFRSASLYFEKDLNKKFQKFLSKNKTSDEKDRMNINKISINTFAKKYFYSNIGLSVFMILVFLYLIFIPSADFRGGRHFDVYSIVKNGRGAPYFILLFTGAFTGFWVIIFLIYTRNRWIEKAASGG